MYAALRTLRYALAAGALLGPATALAVPVVANDVDELMINVGCQIVNALFYLALIVGIIMAIVAAYKYLTSGGDTTKVSEAHRTLTYAAVGIGVAILAGSLPLVVWSLFGTPESIPTC